jgi:Flp pilus assembly protein TadD
MKHLLRASLVAAWLAAALSVQPVLAADTESTPEVNAENKDFTAGKKAVAKKDWAEAAARFRKVVDKEPSNADAYTMLGYSLRWQGKLDEAFAAYDQALRIDPNHRGANQYLGIAYLKAGLRDKAEGQLTKLERIAGKNSDEYKSLSQAISEAKVAKQ